MCPFGDISDPNFVRSQIPDLIIKQGPIIVIPKPTEVLNEIRKHPGVDPVSFEVLKRSERERQKARETLKVRPLVVEGDSGADLRSRVQIVIQSDPTHTISAHSFCTPTFSLLSRAIPCTIDSARLRIRHSYLHSHSLCSTSRFFRPESYLTLSPFGHP